MRIALASLVLAWWLTDATTGRLPALRGRLPIKRAWRLKRPVRRFGVRADGRYGLYTLTHT